MDGSPRKYRRLSPPTQQVRQASVTAHASLDQRSNYKLGERLGTGSFGVVYRALHLPTGTHVAIKQINLDDAEDEINEIQQEIAHLTQCDSSRVTKYYGSFVHGHTLWIVMEFLAGGSCLDLLKPGPLPEAHIAIICREILLGLEYLHGVGKIHRDIKAANILLTSEGNVKLADLGVAAQLSNKQSIRKTFVGTPFWMAPEVIKQTDYGTAADIWSLGITAIELAKGQPPLAEYHPMRVLFLIPQAKAPSLESQDGFSLAFREFVDLCLTKDPDQRPSAAGLLQHRFIKYAHRTDVLVELMHRLQEWRKRKSSHSKASASEGHQDESVESSVISDWSFSTVQSRVRSNDTEDRVGDAAADDAPLTGHVATLSLSAAAAPSPMTPSLTSDSNGSTSSTTSSNVARDDQCPRGPSQTLRSWQPLMSKGRRTGTALLQGIDDNAATARRGVPHRLSTLDRAYASPAESWHGLSGKAFVRDVMAPVLQEAARDATRQREKSSLHKALEGFAELADENPQLAYSVFADLAVTFNKHQPLAPVRAQQRQTGIAAEYTSQKAAPEMPVSAEEDRVAYRIGLSASRSASPSKALRSTQASSSLPEQSRSPIADMLLARWIENTKKTT